MKFDPTDTVLLSKLPSRVLAGKLVHLANPAGCEHADCLAHPELARACFDHSNRSLGADPRPICGARRSLRIPFSVVHAFYTQRWCAWWNSVIEHRTLTRDSWGSVGGAPFYPDYAHLCQRCLFIEMARRDRKRAKEIVDRAVREAEADAGIVDGRWPARGVA